MTFMDDIVMDTKWEAKAMRSGMATICHLFCSLTKIKTGLLHSNLRNIGYDPTLVRRQIRGLLGRPDFWLSPEHIQLDENLNEIFENAKSSGQADKQVSCEKFLLSLIAQNRGNSLLKEKLDLLGIDLEKLISHCLENENINEKHKYVFSSEKVNLNIEKEPNPSSESFGKETSDKYSSDIPNILTQNKKMLSLKTELSQISQYNTDILLIGETGTGKELFARSIHKKSNCLGSLITVNCGAIPSNLFESELFGHKKGSFSGAVADQKGAFELAERGTLFLDEIGELPLDLQPKLLRAIEYREIHPIGAQKNLNVNLKIVFATNRDLKKEVSLGKFREDLYFRISSPCLNIPPLRERIDDVPLLFQFFFEQACQRFGKDFSLDSEIDLTDFFHYHWPGNIRELKKVIEGSVLKSTEQGFQIFSKSFHINQNPSFSPLPKQGLTRKKKFSDEQLLSLMDELGGNKALVAEKLGVAYRTVLRRCKDLGI